MSGFANIALQMGLRTKGAGTTSTPVDIIEFVESSWGLNVELYPVQRVILKAHYGVALDSNPHGFDLSKPLPESHPEYEKLARFPTDAFTGDPLPEDPEWGTYKYRIPVTDWRRDNLRYMSEAEYLEYLYKEGRSNIRAVVPGQELREMVLSVGRRSGKTFMCACIMAYEVYKLILKDDPHAYFGLPKTNVIQLISVATSKDQAGLLYNEASGHFSRCQFYRQYTANNTQTYAKFQTPEDIRRFGAFRDDPTAKATVKVSFSSCIAKGLRGSGNILMILDEIAHFNTVGQSDALTVYQAIKPSMGAFSQKSPHNKQKAIGPVEGRSLLISSPLGRQGFFYKKYMQGFAAGSKNLLCVQASTWEVNPSLDADFLQNAFATDPDSFFTEYGAEFSDRTRGWLQPPDLLACVNENLRPAAKAPARSPHFAGLDISSGLVDGDYCAIAVGHLTNTGHIVLDFIERIRAGEGDYKHLARLSFDDITEWVYKISRRFYIHAGLFDQWAGHPFEAALHKRGLQQFQSEFFTKQLSSQMFHNFKTMMYEKLITLYDFPKGPHPGSHCDYIQELLELQAEMQSKYVTLVAAPNAPGKHDDMADALVRMVWEATKYRGKPRYIAGTNPDAQRGQNKDVSIQMRRKALMYSKLGGTHPSRQIPRRGRR